MHKYSLRLVIDEESKAADKPPPPPKNVLSVDFLETTFIAVMMNACTKRTTAALSYVHTYRSRSSKYPTTLLQKRSEKHQRIWTGRLRKRYTAMLSSRLWRSSRLKRFPDTFRLQIRGACILPFLLLRLQASTRALHFRGTTLAFPHPILFLLNYVTSSNGHRFRSHTA